VEYGLDPHDREDSQYGHIIENRVIEAIEISAGHVIESFRPVTDSGGYDWAGVPFGLFDLLRLVQIKGTTVIHRRGEQAFVSIVFEIGALVPQRNTSFVFALFETRVQMLTRLWRVPSTSLDHVAKHYDCKKHPNGHYHFTANLNPGPHDRASPYEVALDRLARAIFPELRRETARLAGLAPSGSEEGDFFESAFITQFLRDGTGAEKLLRPVTDVGRDVLALTLQPFHWASLAIKGTAVKSHGNDVMAILIKERTFVAHPRHFVLAQYFDRPSRNIQEISLLIPSIVVAQLANRSSGMLQIVTSLNPSHGKWSRWAVPTEKVATTFMRWMRRPPAV
jgi:hypothetical protein